MRKLFKSYLFEGLLMIALGIVMLVWPSQSRTVFVTVIGVTLGLMGVFRIILCLINRDEWLALDLIVGILQIAAGIWMIVKPDFFIEIYPIIVGIILAYGALAMFIFSIRWRRGFRCLLGVIFSLVVAALAVFIILNPASAIEHMTRIHGIALIIEGIFIIILMSRALSIKE